MAKQIALFNHKGGVSKTTTTFHMGWMLAEMGHKVIIVDTDPQCNLTGLVLGFRGENEFEDFYDKEGDRNIWAGLRPAFESQPRAIEAVECLPVSDCNGLFLLPGHISLADYEVTLGFAQELSGSIQALQNLPGSLSHLFNITAERHDADFVLVDMNPSFSSINKNLLMTSDYFIIPTSPDYFSFMAVESLSLMIPRWHRWSASAASNPVLNSAVYPYPCKNPKFLGTIIQRYRPRRGTPTEGFQKWIDKINMCVEDKLVPVLKPIHMVLEEERYNQASLLDFCLAYISDFNTLIAKSQEHITPVFALTDEQLGQVGVVLDGQRVKKEEFYDTFERLVTRTIMLTNDASSL